MSVKLQNLSLQVTQQIYTFTAEPWDSASESILRFYRNSFTIPLTIRDEEKVRQDTIAKMLVEVVYNSYKLCGKNAALLHQQRQFSSEIMQAS